MEKYIRNPFVNNITAKVKGRKNMNYLIVVAHPDDEVLGAGATIHKLVREGNNVAICIMANHAAARANISDTLFEDEKKAFAI